MTISGTQITIGEIVNQPGSTFNGELQENYNVVVSGQLLRNFDGTLSLNVELDNSLFPDVKKGDKPTAVTIRIV